jgi:hypothetical protein
MSRSSNLVDDATRRVVGHRGFGEAATQQVLEKVRGQRLRQLDHAREFGRRPCEETAQ